MSIDLNENITIALPKGGELEVQMSLEFKLKICKQFNINYDELTNDHIRMFIWGSLNSAVEKACGTKDDSEKQQFT